MSVRMKGVYGVDWGGRVSGGRVEESARAKVYQQRLQQWSVTLILQS